MNKEIIMFDGDEIEKRKFHYSEYPININNVDIDKMIIGNCLSFGKNILNTLLDTRLVKKLSRILLPRMSKYTESFDETKYMFFLVNVNIKPGIKSTIVL